MMQLLRSNLFHIRYNYSNVIDRQRAVALLAIGWILFVAWVAWTVSLAASWVLDSPRITDFTEISVVSFYFGLPVVVGLIYWSVQSGRLLLGSSLLVVFLYSITSVPPPPVNNMMIASLFLPLVAAAVLLGRRGLVAAMFVTILASTVSAVTQSRTGAATLPIPPDDIGLNLVVVLTIFLLVSVFLYTLGSSAQIMLGRVMREVQQFRTVGHFAAQVIRNDENSAYTGALRLIRDELGYDFAQIFLADANGQLTQRLRTGLGLMESGAVTDVSVNETSALVEAAQTRKPIVISIGDSVLRREHLLPSSASGVAVPITRYERLVGVLDVQDVEPFTPNRVAALSALADQLAVVLEEIQTASDLRESLLSQEARVNNLRDQLRRYREAERQVLGSVWDTYLEGRGKKAIGFDVDMVTHTATPADDLPEKLHPAIQSGQVRVEEQDGHPVIMVPIRLRGEILGAMSFNLSGDDVITERKLDLAQNVADRLALALENKRLFEQSQAQAIRERKANEVAGLLIGATDVDSVMELAAGSFNEALGAIRTRVHLQPGGLALQEGDRPTQNGGGTE